MQERDATKKWGWDAAQVVAVYVVVWDRGWRAGGRLWE